MKLYNPSLEQIIGGYDGVRYVIDPGKHISLSDFTGQWVLHRNYERGLVDITYPASASKDFDYKLFIVQKGLEGIEKYIECIEARIQSFITRDTDEKAVNQYGTILKSRVVKKEVKLLEDAIEARKRLQDAYGLSIATNETDVRAEHLMNSIDSIVEEFESNNDRKQMSMERDIEIEKMIKEAIPTDLFTRLN